MRKKNKIKAEVNRFAIQHRGFLLAEETLKIVIALIALTFLIYFLMSLYFAKTSENAIERAQNVLIDSDESIKNVVEDLEDGESREVSLPNVYDAGGADDWVLFSFVSDAKPNSCAGQNCLCICDDSTFRKQAGRCDEKGICTAIPSLKSQVEIELDDALNFITIEKTNGDVYIFGKTSTNLDETASAGTKGSIEGYFGTDGGKTETTSGESVAETEEDIVVGEGEETAGLLQNTWSNFREGVRDFFGWGSGFDEDSTAGVKG